MKCKNRIWKLAIIAVLGVFVMAGCSKTDNAETASESEDNGKINVVATIFPEYDFLRQIGGDYINLEMLLTPGAETHSFEPTPQNIKDVGNADLFVYVGGDSDSWVSEILDSVDLEDEKIITLMDCVSLVEEETTEGMTEEEEEEEEGEVEYDEHVWTSPKNAMLIVQKLSDALCEIDPDHADEYKANTEAYLNDLQELDQSFQDVVDNAKRTEIIVADRFPFRYFADAYGLTYYAAFPGCSTDTEASASTVKFLMDKVKTYGIPVVFHIELSNEKMCDSICEETGAKKELLHAVHNVSKDDFEAGVTYLSLMQNNVKVLEEALN